MSPALDHTRQHPAWSARNRLDQPRREARRRSAGLTPPGGDGTFEALRSLPYRARSPGPPPARAATSPGSAAPHGPAPPSGPRART